MFLLRLPEKLGRKSYKAVLVVQAVLKSKINAVVVDEDLSMAVERHSMDAHLNKKERWSKLLSLLTVSVRRLSQNFDSSSLIFH